MKVSQDFRGASSPTTLAVRIYASIRRDYIARGVFPELCPPVSFEFKGTTTHQVTREVALAMQADATQQRARPYTGEQKGTKKVYTALLECIRIALDPEAHAREVAAKEEQRRKYVAEAEDRRAAAPPNSSFAAYLEAITPVGTQLQAGDRVYDAELEEECVIVRRFGRYSVDEGIRAGYIVRYESETVSNYRHAGALYRDGKPTHLALVSGRPQ